MKGKISKKKLWILIACVLAVLVAAAVTVTVILLNRNATETDAPADSKIYWNIDRQLYYGQGEGGASSREISTDDGYYHVVLAAEGRPVERKARSLTTINKIDGYDAMGIVIDEKTRAITDVIPIEDLGAYFLCNRFYVDTVDGYTLKLNSSASFLGEELEIKLKTTTPIYDVSLQAQSDAGMPAKLESIEHKDQISIIQNRDGSIYGVYITKRAKVTPVYWNVERKYDSKFASTTREPDADGVYHLLMAVGGQQVTVKCKDKQVVTQIDARANKSCGLEFDDEGFVINSIAATKCTGGKSVASWYDVMSIDGYSFFAEKHSVTASDNGNTFNLTMDPDCEVYNVSSYHENFVGEATQLQLTDRVQGFTDPTGKVVVLFIVQRWRQGDFYWNAYRAWDSTNSKSSRTREADGYFHVLMCVNGKLEEYRVADQEVMDALDKIASRSMGLDISNGIITAVYAPGEYFTSKGSWYDVEKFTDSKTIHVKKNQTTASDYGKEYDIELADYCKVYNVTESYTNNMGEETTLRVGDRIQGWVDYTGKAAIIYVVSRNMENPMTAHSKNHKCEDCNANVTWTPWTSGSSLPITSGHYYLTGDVVAPQASIAKDQKVVLCLNGHTVKAAGKRIYATFETGSSLAIHDCVGTGTMKSTYAGPLGSTQGAIIWARNGDVSLFGGTYIAPTGKTDNTGPVISTNSNVTIKIKNATVIGGTTSKNGAAIWIGAGGKTILDLEDTTIISGKSDTGLGNGVFMSANSKLNVAGKVVISGSGSNDLYLASNALITMNPDKPLAPGSKIVVATATSGGKITSNYIEGCEQYFESADKSLDVNVVPGGFVYLDKNYSVTEHKANHICEECGDEDVEWTPWTSTSALPTASGHYYLCGDVSTGQNNLLTSDTVNVVLCLNGYTIKGTGNRIYSSNGVTNDSSLTIADCVGSGRMYNGKTSGNLSTTQGGVIWMPKGTLNIFGGTYEATSAKMPGSGSVFCGGSSNAINIKNATIKGGPTAASGGAIYVGSSGKLSLENVEVKAGKADGTADGIFVSASGTVTLAGKVVIGGGKNNLYLSGGAYITFAGALTEGSSISINTSSGSGKISTNYFAGAENYFISEVPGSTVKYMNGALYFDDGKTVIEEHKGNHACEECGEDVEWMAWTDTTTLPTITGHYYLAVDVTTGQNTVGNENVVLCLNGHEVKGTGNRIYALNDGTTTNKNIKLTLTDCVGSGRMYNGKTSGSFGTAQGGVIWVRTGVLNIFGGTYEATSATMPGNGSVICSDNSNNKITIKNATIIGGPTERNGGAIYAGTSNTVTLENVDIKSGSADALADAIYLGNSGKLVLSGKVAITGGTKQVYLSTGAYITFADKLTEGSSLSVNSADGETQISTNYFEGAENFITSEKDGIGIKVMNDALYYSNAEEPEIPEDDHKDDHVCEECGEAVTWTAWTSTTSLPTTSGHYYLTANVVTGQNTINSEANVVLCLNGYEVTNLGSSGNRLYALNGGTANTTLTISDCVGTGKMHNNKTTSVGTSTQGGVVWVRNGNLNIFGGTFVANSQQMPGNGSAICADGTANNITIKNATVIGGPTNNNGGAIYVGTSGSLTLENVDITSGTATKFGDAIYMGTNSKLVLSGKIAIEGGNTQVYLATGAYITFADKLTEGSNIVVDTVDGDGKLSTNYVEGAEDYIKSGRANTNVKPKDDALYFDIPDEDEGLHKHAVFGNSASAAKHGISDTRFIYTAVATEEELIAAINNAVANTPIYIFLDDDIALSEATKGSNTSNYFINFQAAPTAGAITTSGTNKKINLCLNGHTLSTFDDDTKGTVKILQLNANGVEFTICDCADEAEKGGLISGRTNYEAANSGGMIYIASGAKLNLYGIKLTGGTAKEGGFINVMTGTANIYDCEFTGGASMTGMISAGNKNSTINIYDSSFTGAKVGYGIYLAADAKAPVLSGKIVVKDNAAGNIYLPNGKTVTFKELEAGSEIGVSPVNTGVAFADSDKDYSEICNIFSDIEGKAPYYQNGKYLLANTLGLSTINSRVKINASTSNLTVLSPVLNLLREAGLK